MSRTARDVVDHYRQADCGHAQARDMSRTAEDVVDHYRQADCGRGQDGACHEEPRTEDPNTGGLTVADDRVMS